jgi:hypothetical protein
MGINGEVEEFTWEIVEEPQILTEEQWDALMTEACTEGGAAHPQEIRRLVKEDILDKAEVIFHGISRRLTTTVAVRVRYGEEEITSVGAAKWRKPDTFNYDEGYDIAFGRAIVDLVDKALRDNRRRTSSVFHCNRG